MKTATRSFYESAVQRALEQVVGGLDRALDFEQLARHAAMSPFHFHRVFRGMVGETPLELHRRLRLERAAWQLLESDASVTSLAFGAGYETHEAFTRAFAVHFGMSPSQFRRAARAPACVGREPAIATRTGIHYRPGAIQIPLLPIVQGVETMNVQIKDMPELRVASVPHVGPYNRISEAFARLGQVAGRAHLFGPHTTMLAVYHDDPESTPPAELRSDAGITVPPDTHLPAELSEVRIPAGHYATTTHIGPYEQLGDTWSRLMGEWLPRSERRLCEGVSFEIYRNSPMDTPKEKLVTELYIPIAQ